jgi:uncharacterized protein (DUF1499 family)
MNKHPTWVWIMASAAIFSCGAGCSGHRPGPAPGTLEACPESPNCVSSLSTRPQHAVAPLAFTGSADQVRRKLLGVIRAMPRTRILRDDGRYLHVEFTSAVFRFVDDVEFLIDEHQRIIHVRSASRVGYWDLGVNRRRIENIRRKMEQDPLQENGS